MTELWLVCVAGFAASLVDGALGMGFGPTSSSLLLSAGVSPVATATTVNLAKVVTGLVSGGAHWRAGNVDRRLMWSLAIPGAIGALVGTTLLVILDADVLRPIMGAVLTVVGLRLLVRFSLPIGSDRVSPGAGLASTGRLDRPLLVVAGGGGVTNGIVGAWGPVVTPYLLHRGVLPRLVVGSVNTAEIAVAVVSVGSLVGALGGSGLSVGVVLAMLGGGVVAAPIAAHVVRFVQPRILGLGVAALLLVTQTRELAAAVDVAALRPLMWGLIAVLVLAALLRPRLGRVVADGREVVPVVTSGSTSSAP